MEKGPKGDKWSEVKGIWSAGKSSIYREKIRKVLSEVKWSEGKGIWSTEEMEYFQEQGMESDKWSEMKWSEGNFKWGEDQLNWVKGRELRRGGVGCEVYIRVVRWSEV